MASVPTIEVSKNGLSAVCNVADKAAWEAIGYKERKPEVAMTTEETESKKHKSSARSQGSKLCDNV